MPVSYTHLDVYKRQALYIGIENAVQGKRLGDIGYAIQEHCESNSFGVVRLSLIHILLWRLVL